MLEKLISFDRSLFLGLNGIHAAWLDPVMYWMSDPLLWLPFFIILLYLVIRTFKWKTLTILAAVAVMITVSDQMSNLVKHDVKRLRPSNDPGLSASIHLVKGYRGGEYGYYSAHASNTFAVAVFLIILFQKRYRYIYLFLIGWAALMTYTRIYLGVHYPLDILSGAIIGSLLGWFAGRITIYLLSEQRPKLSS